MSKQTDAIYRPQTKRWTLLVLLGLILPSLGFEHKRVEADDKVNVVVIDAGHGGKDPGNVGTGRYRKKEKDVSLNVALLLGKYIEENLPDVKVIYTRDDDTFLELHERCNIANEAGADLFISIHCNAATARSAYGTETYVMGLTREEANLEVSRKENSVIFLEDNYEENYEGFDPNSPLSTIFGRLSQSAHLDQSVEYASLVQDQFRERVQRRDRGVKQSVLYVLDYTAMPSVLIELGFLTNRNEEDFLLSERGQELMASGIYRAFKDYKLHMDAIADGLVIQERPDSALVENQPEIEAPAPPHFAVQIMVSSNLVEQNPENFGGLEGVSFYKEGRLYKYILDGYSSKADALEAQARAKAAGFNDAYLVAFHRGEKISVGEAERLLQ
ncbi:N-acetylmuramoyl-L-alanine amidase family protein [Phaeocystidibacter luteus]|uniref:N-acetylmuramoyl-L-alanine amidase family protein n=1 Tax=Phaeocystidibacter luteus TaxID=911197 RepID=UPI0014786728|nr:N-acetylmuramoyl-L-alanine amidase [Phaeocystidibacter luteus]